MTTSERTPSDEKRTISGHHEGSIWWREDRKRWVVEVSLPNGRRRTAQARTKPEAKQKLKLLLGTKRAAAGLHPRMKFGRFLAFWVANVSESLGPKTASGYRGIVNNHLIPGLGHYRMDELGVQDVQTFINDPERGVSAQTAVHHRAVLVQAFNDAARLEVVPLDWNPAAKSRAPRVLGLPPRILSLEGITRITDDPEPDRLHALWVLNACSGMRQAEMLGLTWDDVDGATVKVRHQLVRQNGEWVRRELKTKRVRDTEIPDDAVNALRRHRGQQARDRLASGHGGAYTGLIFTTPTGTPIYGWLVLRDWYRMLDRLGLPRMTFHAGGRHTYSSAAMEVGTDWRVAADQTGHSTAAMVGHYSHVSPALRRQAAADYQAGLDEARTSPSVDG